MCMSTQNQLLDLHMHNHVWKKQQMYMFVLCQGIWIFCLTGCKALSRLLAEKLLLARTNLKFQPKPQTLKTRPHPLVR